MNPPKRTIRPYLIHSLDIKSPFSYRDFLRRRPKRTLQFKFSIPPQNQFRNIQPDEKQIQLKFLKVLKTAKPLLKIDLKEFIITGSNFWKAGILSAWKKVFHVKALCVTLMKPEAESMKRYFKYFPRLKLLNYQLNDSSRTMLFIIPRPRLQFEPPENYLQYLKYSPRIHSLRIQDSSTKVSHLIKSSCESRRYFKSLHNLNLRSQGFSFVEHSVPVEFCENLESISLRLMNSSTWLGLPRVLNILPTLPHLKEIYLGIGYSQLFNLANAFREIAKKGILEKISLELGCFGMQEYYDVLEPLKLCKLKHFSLLTGMQKGLFTFISGFLQSMSSLESFELSTNLDANDNDYIEICTELNKLQKLRSLKLHIGNYQEIPKSPKIQCYLHHLSDVFKKPIKIETLHLSSNKLPAAEALESLISVLGPSTPFLTHLKIDFGALPNIKKTYRSLLPLLKDLSRIQVLEIPGLGATSSTGQLLIEIARALHGCIYLRVFKMGEIKPTVAFPDFFNALEIIWSKRGLRQFDCVISNGLQNKFYEGAHAYFPDMKKVIEKNPQLDTRSLANNFSWLIYSNEQWIGDFFSNFGYAP